MAASGPVYTFSVAAGGKLLKKRGTFAGNEIVLSRVGGSVE